MRGWGSQLGPGTTTRYSTHYGITMRWGDPRVLECTGEVRQTGHPTRITLSVPGPRASASLPNGISHPESQLVYKNGIFSVY